MYFRGGKITTIFGSNEINLANAQLADGQNELDLLPLVPSINAAFTKAPGRIVHVEKLDDE